LGGKKVGEKKSRVGVKNARQEKRFFGFYAKTVADTGFWSAPLERTQKLQPEEKILNLSIIFCQLFVKF